MDMRTFVQTAMIVADWDVRVRVWLDDELIKDSVLAPDCNWLADVDVTANDDWPVLFTWQRPWTWKGQAQLRVICDGGQLILGARLADYSVLGDTTALGPYYLGPQGEEQQTYDPYSNVTIAGQLETPDRHQIPGHFMGGSWCWHIPNGAEFTATINVNMWQRAEVWTADTEFVPGMYAIHEDRIYRVRLATGSVQPGTPVTDTKFFLEVDPATL